MTDALRNELLNYLKFMKGNGYLYVEEPGTRLDRAHPSVEPLREAGGGEPPRAAPQRPSQAAEPVRDQEAEQVLGVATDDFFGGPAPSETPSSQPGHEVFEGPPLSRDERIERLRAAAERAEACRACPLGDQRNRLVYGDGDPEAEIVFVGEAPGAEEDAQGIPFVGRAGQLLEKMLAAIGFTREEVFICNTLKCRPPGNRDPEASEKKACEPFLVEQLEILRPKILIALGAHAARYLCGVNQPMGKLRGRWYRYRGVPLIATYHPSYLLRPNGQRQKPKSWEDFQMIHAKYSELRPDDPRPLWSKPKR